MVGNIITDKDGNIVFSHAYEIADYLGVTPEAISKAVKNERQVMGCIVMKTTTSVPEKEIQVGDIKLPLIYAVYSKDGRLLTRNDSGIGVRSTKVIELTGITPSKLRYHFTYREKDLVFNDFIIKRVIINNVPLYIIT
jgi:hypothetical protein